MRGLGLSRKIEIPLAGPIMSRMSDQLIPADYAGWLADLKSRIQRSRTQAALAVNQELVRLYHHIGSEILARQGRQGWGFAHRFKLVSNLLTNCRGSTS